MDSIYSNLHSSSIAIAETFASIPGINIATPILALILAVFLALFGYKAKKITLSLVWFLLGFLLVTKIANIAFSGVNAIIILIIGLIVGAIFAFLGFKIEQAAILISVTFLSFLILSKFIHVDQEIINFAIKGIISLIIGGVALSFTKPIFIVITSIYAGSLTYIYLPELVALKPTIILIIALAVIIVGIATQFSLTLKED